MRVDHIVPVKNYEVHVLISLKACYNNSEGRILQKTGLTGLVQNLRETRISHGNSMKYSERTIIVYQTSQRGLY